MALGKCGACGKASDTVLEVVLTIAGRRKAWRLCKGCRAPFDHLMEVTPGKARGSRRTRTVVPIDPWDIPLDRPPTQLKPVRKRK